MKHINDMIGVVVGLLMLMSTALLCAWQADAAQIQLQANSINMFRNTQGANDVGNAQGDRLQFGANVIGGSAGTTLGAVYPPTGFTASQVACDPLAVNANFCARSVNFNVNRLAQPWTLRFEKNGFDPLTVTGPPLLGVGINDDHILQPVPFPLDVTISGSGLTPTISWTVPDSFVPDGFRVQIFDKDRPSPIDGSADIIHTVAVPSTATSYTIPEVLSNNLARIIHG
jgi:hypothetical protein